MSKRLSYFDCGVHPTRVYAGPDLAVAYIGSLNDVSARAVVWPDKKLYTTIYGDTHRMETALGALGYAEGSDSDFLGARLQRIEEDGKFVMPYLDMGDFVDDCGDYLTITNHGDIGCRETDGYAEGGERGYCEWSDARCDADDLSYIESVGMAVCDDALSRDFFTCDIFDEYYPYDRSVEVITGNGSTIQISDSANEDGDYTFTCEGNGNTYLRHYPARWRSYATVTPIEIDGCHYSPDWADDNAFQCGITFDWFLNDDKVTLADGSTVSRDAYDDLDDEDRTANPEKTLELAA
jgi:hypothetical protein